VSSISRRASAAARKVASILSSFLPGPPSDEGPPPDIDGQRATDADLAAFNVDLNRKNGKGGYR
jgi:hypothetical protein